MRTCREDSQWQILIGLPGNRILGTWKHYSEFYVDSLVMMWHNSLQSIYCISWDILRKTCCRSHLAYRSIGQIEKLRVAVSTHQQPAMWERHEQGQNVSLQELLGRMGGCWIVYYMWVCGNAKYSLAWALHLNCLWLNPSVTSY